MMGRLSAAQRSGFLGLSVYQGPHVISQGTKARQEEFRLFGGVQLSRQVSKFVHRSFIVV